MSMGLKANADGSGAIQVGGSDAITITSGLNVTIPTGSLLLTGAAAGGIGYGTGSGSTVTQLTSKSTAVTLNKPTGQITMNNAALAANAVGQFTFNNSLIADSDVILFTIKSSSVGNPVNYTVGSGVASGSTTIYVKNISAGSLSEAIVINFAIIKGATS